MSKALNETAATSVGPILRSSSSSSIIGGANALNYLVGLVRIKVVAVLLGPAGVGLISLYTSAMALLGTASGLGLGSSGVREVVRTVHMLRRLCWVIGSFRPPRRRQLLTRVFRP